MSHPRARESSSKEGIKLLRGEHSNNAKANRDALATAEPPADCRLQLLARGSVLLPLPNHHTPSTRHHASHASLKSRARSLLVARFANGDALSPAGHPTRVRLQADDPFDVPRPDPAILVSAKPEAEQKLWIAGIGAGIAAGVAVLVALISAIDPLLPADVVSFVGNANAVLIGLFFAGLGVAHFAVKDAFTGVVPPLGTWGGLWQVPAPGAEELKLSYAEYHVAWTGVAEVGGGLLLAASGLGLVPAALQQVDAFLLFLLTIAVTPANVYQFTHDAQMVGAGPPLKYPDSHIVRAGVQVVLLGELWKLAFH